MTILELSVASSIIAVILLASFALLQRDNDLAHSTLGIAVAEMKAQQMLRKLEGELADARGATLNAVISAQCASDQTSHLQVDSTLGFPDTGMLLLERGTGLVERVAYSGLNANGTRFLNLTRGQMCTEASNHDRWGEVMWLGLAEPIEIQDNPPADTFDGVALQPSGPIFYRGDGVGFSYRVPTDPAGGNDYVDGDEIQWGALVGGAQSLNGWHAVTFVPRYTILESDTGDDINNDDDTLDVFEVGQLRRRTWDTTNPATPVGDLGLGPTNVIQEQCNYGSDLDGDGFNDPMFLWDPQSRRLQIQLFILGRSRSDIPIVRKVESMVFLRNQGIE